MPNSICLHAGLFVETVHPAFSTSDLDVKRRRHTTLKRLDFVRAYTEYYWSKANTIASMVSPCLSSLQAEGMMPSLSPSTAACPGHSCNADSFLRLAQWLVMAVSAPASCWQATAHGRKPSGA